MTFQITVLQRKVERAEQELRDIKDKHERELRHERDLNTEKERTIEQERQKNELLKEELRTYKESILQGIMKSESTIRNKCHKESTDSLNTKGLKLVKKNQKMS